MNERNFAIGFIIVTFLAVVILGVTRFNFNGSNSASPDPKLNFSDTKTPASDSAKTLNPSGKKTYPAYPGDLKLDELQNKKAVIQTVKGNIEFELFPEATKSASSFIFLSRENFFDGLTFHRVEKNPQPFVIQGGDPLGNGSGGPGYTFKEERLLNGGNYARGIVAMAKKADEASGTGGSQFFIMLANTNLPPEYAIFGKVIKGQDVMDKIVMGDKMTKVTIEDLK